MDTEEIAKFLEYLWAPEEGLLAACKQENFQASGKGGQKRNRVYSAMRLTFPQLKLQVSASEYREAKANLKSALQKMKMALAKALVGEIFQSMLVSEKMTWPIAQSWRANVSRDHQYFALHCFWAQAVFLFYKSDLKKSAAQLGCSSSALVRFFNKDKELWRWIQNRRKEDGLFPLKA